MHLTPDRGQHKPTAQNHVRDFGARVGLNSTQWRRLCSLLLRIAVAIDSHCRSILPPGGQKVGPDGDCLPLKHPIEITHTRLTPDQGQHRPSAQHPSSKGLRSSGWPKFNAMETYLLVAPPDYRCDRLPLSVHPPPGWAGGRSRQRLSPAQAPHRIYKRASHVGSRPTQAYRIFLQNPQRHRTQLVAGASPENIIVNSSVAGEGRHRSPAVHTPMLAYPRRVPGTLCAEPPLFPSSKHLPLIIGLKKKRLVTPLDIEKLWRPYFLV